MKKVLILISVLVGAISVVLAFSATGVAENGTDCSGIISGVIKDQNVNVGTLTFDAHPYWGDAAANPFPSAYDVKTDLKVVGELKKGFAPGDPEFAACVTVDGTAIKGYAWLTNAAFVSFDGSCGAGCAYGVDIGEEVGGKKYLIGHAWNPVFGYIKFDNGVANGDVYAEMDADSNWVLHGYAWTDAKVWINFNGVVLGAAAPEKLDCEEAPYVCLEVVADPVVDGGAGGSVGGGAGGGGVLPLADGEEGYEIHLYLHDESGKAPLDLNKYVFGDIKFNWGDTVKINQLAGESVGNALDNEEKPWGKGLGAITRKPLQVSFPVDFDAVPGEDGHWKLKYNITSYAPTTDGNVSMTTSLNPNSEFKNEYFFTDLIKNGEVWTDDIESNRLILHEMSFKLKAKGAGGKLKDVIYDGEPYPGEAFADGQPDRSFDFRPALQVSQLYANDLQDSIDAQNGTPFVLYVQADILGNLENELSDSATEIGLKLDYDLAASLEMCAASGDFEITFSENGKNELKGDVGYFGDLKEVSAIAELKKAGASEAGGEEGDEVDEVEEGCQVVVGPTVYSIVSYEWGDNRVSYYSNKLPRLTSSIATPDVVVHGNIYAPQAFTPTHKTQAHGAVGSEIIRNAVDENAARALGDLSPEGGGTCTITDLKEYDNSKVSCGGGSSFETLEIGDENVLYFKGSDVVFELGAWENKWVVIVEGGRIFIDKNIYGGPVTDDRKMTVVGLLPYQEECADNNVYIHSSVTNVQMNLVTGCSVLSYQDKAKLDPNTGLPQWTFAERIAALGNQLLLEGSFSSRNTIGGTSRPDRAVDGYGKVYLYPLSDEERLLVQSFDWNYMRVGKGQLKYENGLPVDQACGKALTIEDMLAIKKGFPEVHGTKQDAFGWIPCDGIQPNEMYDPSTNTGGDLIPKTDGLAKGLDSQTQTNPVYIFFVAPAKDSFILNKTGGLGN